MDIQVLHGWDLTCALPGVKRKAGGGNTTLKLHLKLEKRKKKGATNPPKFCCKCSPGVQPLAKPNSQRLFIPKHCKSKMTAQRERVEGLGVQTTKKQPKNESLGTVRCSLMKKIISLSPFLLLTEHPSLFSGSPS